MYLLVACLPLHACSLSLQVLHPLAMQPAIRSQKMDVRVKNSYNREASGTIISKTRNMACSLVTSIVLKNNVTLVDIVSSRMLGQFGGCQDSMVGHVGTAVGQAGTVVG